MTPEDLRADVECAGLRRVSDAVVRGARPGYRMIPGRTEVSVGASRLGGTPDLPAGAEWPVHNGRPLSFIVQVNLGEVQKVHPEPLLPKTGLLSFFFEDDAWDFTDLGTWRVLHFEADPATFSRRAPPEGRERKALFGLVRRREPVRVYRASGLGFERVLMLPEEVEGMAALSTDEVDRLCGLQEKRGGPHRLLGRSHPVQGAMEEECARLVPGSKPEEWRLLAQIDSDDRFSDMMWGDMGMLYYWIRESDLKERRFENVRLISQCC